MKILIADSGSTKTEWSLVSPDTEPQTVFSAGLNPYYHTVDSIVEELNQAVHPDIPSADRIHFYGSGCTGQEAIGRITRALQSVYGGIPVEADSDLLGAARAICGHHEGIACILGTGSNSCHFDGKRIIDQIPPIGFILGDEGSAGSFGRKILQAYFYREMPQDLCDWLEHHHDMSRSAILEKVYQNKHFNSFVASFTRLFSEFSDHPFVICMLQEGIDEFLNRHVLKYRTDDNIPVGFVGSVAWFNQSAVTSALARKNLKPGVFLRTPMEGLRVFHSRTE